MIVYQNRFSQDYYLKLSKREERRGKIRGMLMVIALILACGICEALSR